MSKLDRPIPMQLNETFKKEKLLHYDICMVFPYDENTNSFHEDSVEAVLQPVFDGLGYNEVPGEGVPEHERFKYDVFKSDDGNGEVFVAVRASVARLKHFADKLDHFFLANPVALKRRTELGWPDKVAPLYIDINPTITKYSPFEPMYLKYRSGEEFQDLYEPMSEARRLGLIHEILTTPKVLGGLQLQFGLLTKVTKPNSEGGSCCGGEKPEIDTAAHAKLIDIFPLHNPEVIAELEHNWAGKGHFLPWQQPISDIRHYYGEKIALYYTWLSHFSLFIIFPSIIGLAAEFLVLVYLDLSFPVIPFYALFVVIWAVFLSEFWKRKEKFTAMKHGMLDFERTESYRTDFESECRTHITGSELLYFPPWKRSLLVTQSFFVAFALCGCVIGTTAAIYTGRLYYASQNAFGNSYASIFASFANSAQIQFWGFIYAKFSNQLTDRENHRTDTEYYDSMIAKNFIFSFVNSYASFFYIAYFASSLPLSTYPGEPADDPKLLNRGQCGYPSCMYTLAINLGTIS